MSSPVRLALLAATTIALSASCAPIPAYRRGALAHPTMAPGSGASPAREHVEAVHEGALGGGMKVSSGCGCN